VQGKGVGAASLDSLRSVDVIFHLLREFESEEISHYEGSVDPVRDLYAVEQEILQYV
jgi:ribosome-binding ATPase YchF (GTP1/OBG family)